VTNEDIGVDLFVIKFKYLLKNNRNENERLDVNEKSIFYHCKISVIGGAREALRY
jgi:hypothetical protein